MDLTTNYMGFHLPNPFIAGAGPLSDTVAGARRLEDAGASMIVLRSLFEEQITAESLATHQALHEPAHSFGEAATYLPEPSEFAVGPQEYLTHLQRVREAVDVPVLASLNGTTPGGWLEYARLAEQAGADGIELNLYVLNADREIEGQLIEARLESVIRSVSEAVHIPVAVKLSPFFTSLANFASRAATVGADALVLYNRYFAADVDLEMLAAVTHLHLSTSADLLPRLRWLAILFDRVEASLAVTGGVHTAVDAVKAMMCGASAVQTTSALLLHGPEHLRRLRTDLTAWLEENEYANLRQLVGSLSLSRCPNPQVYERANYMHLLQTWQGVSAE